MRASLKVAGMFALHDRRAEFDRVRKRAILLFAGVIAYGAVGALTVSAQSSNSDSQTVTAQAQESETPTQTSFEASFVELQELVSRRRWGKVEKLLLTLLREHAGAKYVLPHLQGLREELRRASFWKKAKDAEPKKLVSGELLRYTPQTGRIKISYDRLSLGDFEDYGDGQIHPMHLTGSWSVTLTGTHQQLARRSVFFEFAPSEGYGMTFGAWVKGAPSRFDHQFQKVTRGGQVELGTAVPKERAFEARPVTAKFSVSSRELKITYDRKLLFKHKLQGERLGRIALIPRAAGDLQSFGEVTIEGRIDSGWISGLLDAELATQREKFDLQWKEPIEFSAWNATEKSKVIDLGFDELLERVQITTRLENPAQEALYKILARELGQGRFQAVDQIQQLIELPAGALSESATAYLLFRFGLELGYHSLALRQYVELEFPPENALERSLLFAELLLLAGRKSEAEGEFRTLAKEHPLISLTHSRHAETLLLMGRANEAHEAILRGRTALPFSTALRDLEIKVVKAVKGPPWEQVFESRGDHFIVRTDIDQKLAARARQVLDEAWNRCESFFGPLEHEPTPLPAEEGERKANCHSIAYLFAGEASYLQFVSGIADDSPENTLGLYNTFLKHIAVWNQPNEENLWQTVRHEVAHRYLDLSIGERIPRWLNEGLAEHFAASWQSGIKKGDPRSEIMMLGRLLTGKEPPHLYEFMMLSEEEFMTDPQSGYALAWAAAYAFFGARRDDGKLLGRLLKTLQAGEDPLVAIDSLLAKMDPAKVQKRFIGILNGLTLAYAIRPVTFKLGR